MAGNTGNLQDNPLRRPVSHAPDSPLLSCMEKIERTLHGNELSDNSKAKSMFSVMNALESLSRQKGLNVHVSPSGTSCYITSMMFYLEAQLEKDGNVMDVKLAHFGEAPMVCDDLVQLLRMKNYDAFGKILEDLSNMYQIPGNSEIKAKGYLALKALEKDLYSMSLLDRTQDVNRVTEILHGKVGHLVPRTGGTPMNIEFYISPYQILEAELNPGSQVCGTKTVVTVEGSDMLHKLPLSPLIVDPPSGEDSNPAFLQLTDELSMDLPALFVLKFHQPVPMSSSSIEDIQRLTGIQISGLKLAPLYELIVQSALKEKHSEDLSTNESCFFVNFNALKRRKLTDWCENKSQEGNINFAHHGNKRRGYFFSVLLTVLAEPIAYLILGLSGGRVVSLHRAKVMFGKALIYKTGDIPVKHAAPKKVVVMEGGTTYDVRRDFRQNCYPFCATVKQRYCVISLPDCPKHCYFINKDSEKSDLAGALVSKIPFSHPKCVPGVIEILRHQVAYNTLISSCVSDMHINEDDSELLYFEVVPHRNTSFCVFFLHPGEENLACVIIDVITSREVHCHLQLNPQDPALNCSDDFIARAVKRCMSVPVVMRAIFRNAAKVKADSETQDVDVETKQPHELPSEQITDSDSLKESPSVAGQHDLVGTDKPSISESTEENLSTAKLETLDDSMEKSNLSPRTETLCRAEEN